MKHAHHLHTAASILLVLAGLNFGFMGLFNMDVVASVFGMMSGLTRIIYVLMGLSAVYKIILWAKARG